MSNERNPEVLERVGTALLEALYYQDSAPDLCSARILAAAVWLADLGVKVELVGKDVRLRVENSNLIAEHI